MYERAKLATVDDLERASRAAEKLEDIQKSKPSISEMASFAGLGGGANLASDVLGSLMSGRELFEPPMRGGQPIHKSPAVGRLRTAATAAGKGMIMSAAVPLLQDAIKRKSAEIKLREALDAYKDQMTEQPAKLGFSPATQLSKSQRMPLKGGAVGPSISEQFKPKGLGTGKPMTIATNTTD